jgi:hypothetical protein
MKSMEISWNLKSIWNVATIRNWQVNKKIYTYKLSQKLLNRKSLDPKSILHE